MGRVEELGVTLLAYSPAQDKNAYVVTGGDRRGVGLSTVSDLQPVAGDLIFGGPPECPERPLCLPGLQEVYGLEFAEFVPRRRWPDHGCRPGRRRSTSACSSPHRASSPRTNGSR